MRLNINLASQKYEDVKQFYVRWGTAIALLVAFTVALAILAWLNYSSASSSSQRIQELQRKIAALQKERAAAEEISNRPENHDVTAQKNYWNKQFLRRSFSWTQLFNDLQRIMPARAFVSSVHPEITPDNRLKLTLEIKGDKHDNALELVQRMEKSERFRGTTLSSDSTEKDQRSGALLYKLDIVTYYMPSGAPQQRAGAREGL
jgi:hypothetical protein